MEKRIISGKWQDKIEKKRPHGVVEGLLAEIISTMVSLGLLIPPPALKENCKVWSKIFESVRLQLVKSANNDIEEFKSG